MRIPTTKPWASPPRYEEKKPATAAADGGTVQPGTPLPYQFGDPIPKSDAVENDTDTVWAEWSGLVAAENRKFADTAPASDLMRLSADERSCAATVPAPLQNLLALPMAPVQRELTVVEVMVEARLNNRVCPNPSKWLQLYEMLPNKKLSEPSPPLVDAAWEYTGSIPKRMCFREHIEWADSQGVLQEVFTFMKSVPEDEWHHMGD